MTSARTRLERVWRWRQVSVWAPVAWFPAMVFGLSTGRTALALTVGFAGLLFAGLTRLIVWLGHCPRCKRRWSRSPGGFQRIWDDVTCGACGLSLFSLRREIAAPGMKGRP